MEKVERETETEERRERDLEERSWWGRAVYRGKRVRRERGR